MILLSSKTRKPINSEEIDYIVGVKVNGIWLQGKYYKMSTVILIKSNTYMNDMNQNLDFQARLANKQLTTTHTNLKSETKFAFFINLIYVIPMRSYISNLYVLRAQKIILTF